MTIQVGDTIGDYQVTGVLGKGGMGRVFRVRSLLTDREDAMKVVLQDLADNPDLADRFLREVKVHASLKHPNIAALYTALRVGDGIAMILELVDGVSLEEEMRRGPLDAAQAVRLVREVLSALEYAHGRGVIHRDIKPANILVTPQGQVKLTDFGIARAGGDRRLTHTGVALGSLYYMSPEQVRSAPVDARADIYSLGVTFYEMVTGRRAIQADSEFAIMCAQLSEVPVPPSDVIPGLPRQLSDVIMRALAKDPAARFQSAAEFRAALGGGQETLPVAAPVDVPGFTQEELARIERKLARAVGPIARRLVADAARRCATVPEIWRAVAEQIGDAGERREFLQSCGTDTPATGTRIATARVWDPALLASLTQCLGAYVGPIARVVVNRAAKSARTEEELCAGLAAEIPAEAERKRFLAAVEKRRGDTTGQVPR